MKHATIALLVAACAGGPALAAEGAYSEAQAERGNKVSIEKCGLCHAEDLSGTPGAPSLHGPGFTRNWNTKTVGELYAYLKASMPPGETGSLTDQQYADVTAVILKVNKQPSGAADLAPDGPGMKTIIAIP